ncbi:unnamed protein product [Staurois parvus]|uniref:Uncharacterized protein n=1 Tax=Staurois parvus TaxID=386267 RepID=A0ABN9EX77_9NEOB|nr:unnamed protein product [Staurois parvus]
MDTGYNNHPLVQCRRLLQTLVKEWVALRSSVTPSVYGPRDRWPPGQ